MNKENSLENIAFIDGQNLYMSTCILDKNTGKRLKSSWINFKKFRVYLKEKYKVKKAYYFLGVADGKYNYIYEKIQTAGFILVFRRHDSEVMSKKKGNVDTDLVFSIMKKLYKQEIKNKAILISGDGDYIKMVDFLIEENKFEKILFPDQKCSSSLYKSVDIKYKADLSISNVKRRIKKD